LNALIPGGADGGRYWPVPDAGTSTVVLVARSHASGLRAAQAAARQWADQALPPSVRLAGLAVVADASGRLPKSLRELLQLVAGGVPAMWHLPWIEALRLGDPPDQIQLPSAYSAMAAELQRYSYGAADV
jgi:hypothetical protein